MKNFLEHVFLTMAICIFLISCDDDKDSDETYPYFYVTRISEYEPVKLYTNRGVITDQEFIKNFRQRLENLNNHEEGIFFIPKNFGDFVFDNDAATITREVIAKRVSKDSVEIIHPDYAFDVVLTDGVLTEHDRLFLSAVKYKNGITYWESKNIISAEGLYYDGNYFYILDQSIKSEKLTAFSKFGSLTPLYYVKAQTPDVMGLNIYSEQKSCVYLVENNSDIYIPYFTVLYKKQTETATYKLNNISLPDDKIISQLAENDTLVVQQSKLYLSKESGQ